MKVLMVISQFYPIIGGAEKQAQLLVKELFGKGIEVKLVTGWWNPRTPRKETIDGIKVFRNFSCWGMFGIRVHRTIRLLGGFIYMISLGVYLLIHRHEYDIIHVHQALYPAFISVLVGKQILRKPVIVKTASSGITSDIKSLSMLPLGSFQLRYLVKRMDCLVTVSHEAGKEFIANGYPQQKILYIPNGVSIPPKAKSSCGRVMRILTIARLSREKGIDVLVRAWTYARAKEEAARLEIVGSGPLESELKKLCKSLNIAESVHFVGMVHNPSDYLKQADLFVLPSRSEGMSNALLEAMSYGIPCIATNVGGNPEVFGMDENRTIPLGEYILAKNGVLVNPDDADGLCEAILYLIRNGRTREEMGKRSRRFIQENYSIDLIADKYIALYQRMMEGKV
jgi:glycosyltransferase involved in cell wall biosynthesis